MAQDAHQRARQQLNFIIENGPGDLVDALIKTISATYVILRKRRHIRKEKKETKKPA